MNKTISFQQLAKDCLPAASCTALKLAPALLQPNFDDDHPRADTFRALIKAAEFPCVGAKAALNRQQINFIVAQRINSGRDDLRVLFALLEVIRRYQAERALFRTFVVIFDDDNTMSEVCFEGHMWDRIQSLTDKDDWLGYSHDASVDHDPSSPHFSLSFGGEAFFVVGLHPRSSRPARRFIRPAMVFNLHDQFVTLRTNGKYEQMRETIIARDIELAGTPNPMLARHGDVSEARQYSGRPVLATWRCPYRRPSAAAC